MPVFKYYIFSSNVSDSGLNHFLKSEPAECLSRKPQRELWYSKY